MYIVEYCIVRVGVFHLLVSISVVVPHVPPVRGVSPEVFVTHVTNKI